MIVGVLTQTGAEAGLEGEPSAWIGLALGDVGELDLDRIFQRDHAQVRSVELLDDRIEGRCLATPGGAAHHDQARGELGEAANPLQLVSVHAQVLNDDELVTEQHTHDQVLAVDRRKCGCAQVHEPPSPQFEAELPILREAPHRHVHAPQHLHAREQGGRELEG